MTKRLEELLEVGQPMMAQLDITRKDAPRYPSALRGWEKDSYMLLKYPVSNGYPVPLHKGVPCVVRFLKEGYACGFVSRVMESGKGSPLFQITWPDHIECQRIRKQERMQLSLPCVLQTTDGVRHSGQLKDLSVGGMRVLTQAPLKADEEFVVHLPLKPGGASTCVSAVVRHTRPKEDGTALGCEFIRASDEFKLEVEFFVSLDPARARSGDGHPRRVLIVESNPEILRGWRRQLEPLNCELVVAPTVMDAFHSVRIALPRVIIVRSNLPELSGIEFCRLLRATRGMEEYPILLTYGDMDEAASNAAEELRIAHCCLGLSADDTTLALLGKLLDSSEDADDLAKS